MVNRQRKQWDNVENWKRTQKYIRIEHNKLVVSWFKSANTSARINLRNSIFIYPKDTASQILVKIEFFNTIIKHKSDDILTLPLQYDTRLLPNISQLAIIYRPTDKKIRSGNYTLHIPHYNGNRSPKVSKHTKGNYWARFTCTDGSPIMVYCSTKTEAIRVASELNRYVETKYRSDSLKPATGYMAHEPNKNIKVKPIRADYYKQGKKNSKFPNWRFYY